jgi:hypothetical protein
MFGVGGDSRFNNANETPSANRADFYKGVKD